MLIVEQYQASESHEDSREVFMPDIAKHFLNLIEVESIILNLERISRYDRYQASQGIIQAANYVAETAHSIGLADVSVEFFPADGKTKWWSFEAPIAWTPKTARLIVCTNQGNVLNIDHAKQPFSLATYSAATPKGDTVAPLVDFQSLRTCHYLNGAVVVVNRLEYAHIDHSDLVTKGVVGFITDATCCYSRVGEEYNGRIELDPRSQIFGFSVTSKQLNLIQQWMQDGATAHIIVDIDRSATMPVVTAVLPGTCTGSEVWLTAHLCHPRPGANDNASGVSALLGVADALISSRQKNVNWGLEKTIRFLWGPEYLGVASILHRQITSLGQKSIPSAVINLDMVGEDQSLCECPFIVEEGPDCRPLLINPIANHVVSQIFNQTDTHYGTWRSSSFLGFSDHALFADASIGAPAVQFCHAPDRFNHSSGDTLDKVSDIEMLRSTAAAATLASLLASDKLLSYSQLEDIVEQWCTKESETAQFIAKKYASSNEGQWQRLFENYVSKKNLAMRALLHNSPVQEQFKHCQDTPYGDQIDEPSILRNWSGPINIRSILTQISSSTSSAVSNLIKSDKKNYAILLNYAIRIDGKKTQSDIMSEVSFALRKPIDDKVARQLFDALLESNLATQD
jgi:hypothetical protein